MHPDRPITYPHPDFGVAIERLTWARCIQKEASEIFGLMLCSEAVINLPPLRKYMAAIVSSNENYGASVLPLIFIGIMIYSLIKSTAKIRTTLYTLLAIFLAFLVTLLIGIFKGMPGSAIGAIAFDTMIMAGTVTAAIHSRRTLRSKA